MSIDLFSAREQVFSIAGPVGQLEVASTLPKEDGGEYFAVVCHPHPLQEGSMNNKVVTTVARCYRDLGVPVLRFNFRGVGQSEGDFDYAVGEVDDLLAVVAWARQQLPGRKLLLAGFSFGSSVAAQASHELDDCIEHLTLLAPPVERYAYDRAGEFPCALCVIQGGQDEVVNVAGVYDWLDTLDVLVDLLKFDRTGHFFHGELSALKQRLGTVLSKRLELG